MTQTQPLEFEWNPDKAAENERKHGVRFEYATRIFLDPNRQDREDDRQDYGEERRITVGTIDARVFFVVYTERPGAIRLISARKANDREQNAHAAAHWQADD